MRIPCPTAALAASVLSAFVSATQAQVIVPGADGSDGAFNPTSNVVVRLDLAPTGTWNGPNASPGNGVYDPNKWAIVFRYSSVNIPSGVTVTFFNHPANPPVVWLVSGAVTINGLVTVAAYSTSDPSGYPIGGPGGFRGGGSLGGGGLGPGGGALGQGGSHITGPLPYGNNRGIPLIGGSGGAGNGNGMGGGGAILLAASGTITVNGWLVADGSGGGNETFRGGGGGTIRLICNRLEGTGSLYANGGGAGWGGWPGGAGTNRIEANEVSFASVGSPVASFGLPGSTAQIWPDDTVAPSCRVVSLGAVGVTEPRASFEFPYADVNLTSGTAQTLVIECMNVPTGSDPNGTPAWNVVARIVPRGSSPFTANATYVSGNYAQSTWHATLNLPNGFAAIQVRAAMPPP